VIKLNIIVKLLLLVPTQFISELLIKLLMHDNQSTLSSFGLFLSFVTNSPVAEKTLSGSSDLGLIVIKAFNNFLGYVTSSS